MVNRIVIFILCFTVSNFFSLAAHGQDIKDNIKTIVKAVKVKYDSSYIGVWPKNLTVKIVGSRNFIDYKLIDRGIGESIKYQPNTPVNLGFGASYRGIGLTLGFRTGIVKEYEKYGRTKSFDLSTEIFLPKITFNIYGKYYRGYYVTDPAAILNKYTADPYYIRPDLRTGVIGIDGEYIFNAKRFSMASTFSQKQFQKRSAGSPMLGAGIYTILINADSSIVPGDINNAAFFRGDKFNRSNIYSLVVNVGYAYNLVIHKNYFVSGALNLGEGLSYTTLSNTISDNRNDKLGTQLDIAFKLGVGYNSNRYFVGFQYLWLFTKNMTPISSTREDFDLSSYRLTIARRFKFRQRTIDRTLNQLTK